MSKKIAVIFGGSGGIGLETSRKMIEKNIHVCLVYHDSKKIKNLMQGFKVNDYSLYKSNLLDKDATRQTVEKIIKDHQKVDIIVFSVSHKIDNKSLFRMRSNDFEMHFNLQTIGLLNVVKNLENLIKGGHKIKIVVVLSDVCIGRPPSGFSHYTSAKYSLMGFAKTLAVELAKYNCNVNMISPGMVDTELISNFPSKLIEITAEKNPLKRIASPKDVADAIVFLSGEESDYLNGVNITVNGGSAMP